MTEIEEIIYDTIGVDRRTIELVKVFEQYVIKARIEELENILNHSAQYTARDYGLWKLADERIAELKKGR